MENTTITYISSILDPPCTISSSEYLDLVRDESKEICHGLFDICIATRIENADTAHFFPMLEVSGTSSSNHENRIREATSLTSKTIRKLDDIGIAGNFRIIASGNGGFRLVSRMALPFEYHAAFRMFLRQELPWISNLEAQELPDQPASLLVYFDSGSLSPSHATDCHSRPMEGPWSPFEPKDYLAWTEGHPDPSTYVAFTEWLLDLEHIHDIHHFEKFGEKLEYYHGLLQRNHIFPFQATQVKKAPKPLSLAAVHDHLKSKGIRSRIETRGSKSAISFSNLPCPSCDRSDVRAWAYPPAFRLQCFNAKCEANRNGGIPLLQWAGMMNEFERYSRGDSENSYIQPPTSFSSLDESRELIRQELDSNRNALLLVTPGVGKTHATLLYLAENCYGKTVLYSCLNRRLKDEAYQKCRDMASDSSMIHNLQPREDLCLKRNSVKEVTEKGYSPAKILCRTCDQKAKCEYQIQRQSFGSGVYFVTHPMLQYLEGSIPEPDLIILDEDLVRGFVSDETVTEADMKTLMKVLKGEELAFVENILQLGTRFSVQVTTSDVRFPQIVNGRRISGQNLAEDTILEAYARQFGKTSEQVETALEDIRIALAQFDEADLYEKGVSYKAVSWLLGLCQNHSRMFSYMYATHNGQMGFNLRRIQPLGFSTTPVKILDATGHPKLARALSGRDFEIVRADVAWNSRRTHIKQKLSRTNLRSMRDSDLKKLMKKCLEKINASKILVLTHMNLYGTDFRQKVLDLCQTLEPDKTFAVHHFFGPRGINDYENFEAVLILGLPIPNLNSAWQQACILFPEGRNPEIHDAWIDLSTNWELIQCLHRVRPINRDNTEIIVAGEFWPESLPAPDDVIDESREADKVQMAVERLKPFLKEFGFMNNDLALMAGVFKKGQESMYESTFEDIEMLYWLYSLKKGENDSRISLDIPMLNDSGIISQNENKGSACLLYNTLIGKFHLLQDLGYTNTICILKMLHENLIHNDVHILLTNKQYKRVFEELCGYHKHLFKFSIKSGFRRGQTINGYGIPGMAEQFYSQVNALNKVLCIFKETRISSLTYNSNFEVTEMSLSQGHIVIFIPEYSDNVMHIRYGHDIEKILTDNFGRTLRNIFHDMEQNELNPHIITNNGKLIAKNIIENDLDLYSINDIMLNERIIKNGMVRSSNISIHELIRRYKSDSDELDQCEIIYEIWNEQNEIIKQRQLNWIVKLENDLINIVARMENEGIGVDEGGFENHLLATGQKDTGSEMDRIFNRIGVDGRFHDEIDQVGETRARMTSKLDRVPKAGPWRSFFKVDNAFRLIVADYKQQEPRIIAGLSGDEEMLRIFREEPDFYDYIGNNLEHMADIGRNRQLMKQIVNAVNNRAGLETVWKLTLKSGRNVSEHGVRAFYDGYKVYVNEMVEWQDRLIREAKRNGFVATAMGRRRYLDGHESPSQIINYVVNGTAADGFKHALRDIEKRLVGLDAGLVHTMHDGLIVEVKASQMGEAWNIVEDAMENAFSGMVDGVEFPVDTDIRQSWG